MQHTEQKAATRLPAREIPIPTSISAQAQEMLSADWMPKMEYPPLHDVAGWRALASAMEDMLLPMARGMALSAPADVIEIYPNGAHVYDIRPNGLASDSRPVYLDFHGGGLIMGSGENCKGMAMGLASKLGARVWAVDYRMPPDHPYPSGLDDGVAAYRALLEQRRPEEIIIGGGSAGANLAAATILRARDEGLPLPAAAILMTPELDLTESGDTFQTNLGLDTILGGSLMQSNLLYAAGHDLADPYLSPLFGDFSKGFPPTFLSSGTRDLFLSNTVRMHWALLAANVPAHLFVTEAGPHGGFPMAPEGAALDQQLNRFAHDNWG